MKVVGRLGVERGFLVARRWFVIADVFGRV